MIEWVAWASCVVGALLAGLGLVKAIPDRTVLGMGIIFYSLTLHTYSPLLIFGERQPLTTEDRIWGATFAVLGGWSFLILALAVLHASRTQKEDWANPALRRDLSILSIAAVSSALALRLELSSGHFAPTADFLNVYGDDHRVVLYQLTFLPWIAVPVGVLGYMTWKYSSGLSKVVTIAGCMCGVLWGIWKLTGVVFRFVAGDSIGIESPVSVGLGFLTVLLVICGLGIFGAGNAWRRVSAMISYGWNRRVDDARHQDPKRIES